MDWLYTQVSLYSNHFDTTGRPATLRDILFGDSLRDFKLIQELRALDPYSSDYTKRKKAIKAKMQLFTPSALLASRAENNVILTHYSYLIQMDFDHQDVHQYDLQELKQCIFSLPFTAYCGLSCSGRGIYALIAIAEPERQREYAEHLFHVFSEYGIKPDTGKGRNVSDGRYVSFDSNHLLREFPTPLKIKRFKKPNQKPAHNHSPSAGNNYPRNFNNLIQHQANQVLSAQTGQRWETVQRAAYTLGGTGIPGALDEIIRAIYNNPQFQGEEAKYIKCAQDCFSAGAQKPLIQ